MDPGNNNGGWGQGYFSGFGESAELGSSSSSWDYLRHTLPAADGGRGFRRCDDYYVGYVQGLLSVPGGPQQLHRTLFGRGAGMTAPPLVGSSFATAPTTNHHNNYYGYHRQGSHQSAASSGVGLRGSAPSSSTLVVFAEVSPRNESPAAAAAAVVGGGGGGGRRAYYSAPPPPSPASSHCSSSPSTSSSEAGWNNYGCLCRLYCSDHARVHCAVHRRPESPPVRSEYIGGGRRSSDDGNDNDSTVSVLLP